MKLSRLLRAEYVWQPLQLPRRALRVLQTCRRLRVRLPWGPEIEVDTTESIGRSIAALNVVDLTVLEAISRLLDPGETAADVGANVGCMTAAMASRVGATGEVHAFEPMPELIPSLRKHCSEWSAQTKARIVVHEAAISKACGESTLEVPCGYATNRGIARLTTGLHRLGNSPSETLLVRTTTLDAEFKRGIDLLKIDVEGHEAEAVHGATQLFTGRRVRDVIFEEHHPFPATSHQALKAHGLTVFRLARGLLGPVLLRGEEQPRNDPDPPNYLATIEPSRAQARFAGRGWRTLRLH